MLFLANRANLDRRRLLRRIFDTFDTRATTAESPVERVWYHPSAGNRREVRVRVEPEQFLDTTWPVDRTQLQVSFDFPAAYDHDCYSIQWVEPERNLMLGWHQDETHPELGPCHFQLDHGGRTVDRLAATHLDSHPLNVLDRRTDRLVDVLDALRWTDGEPAVPASVVE